MAYESLKVHRYLAQVTFLVEVKACQAYQVVAEAFSCLAAEEAFWEGSSSSWTRDKVSR